jgi:catechol 2,3-dioxygenase-like lactoylglutathione lyase family enzyme
MIFGAHVIVYSTDAEADKAFLRDVLGFASVDAGHGWLIFKLPPSEAAVHPAAAGSSELYLMCDDLEGELRALRAKGVTLLRRRGGALGLGRQAHDPRRWRGRALPAEPSDGHRPRLAAGRP